MTNAPLQIIITYDPLRLTGRFERRGDSTSSVWDRLRSRAISDEAHSTLTDTTIDLSWPKVLGILRDFGSRAQQQSLGFRFIPEGEAAARVQQFSEEVRRTRAARNTLTLRLTRDQLRQQLEQKGFTRRTLKPFQLRDLERLVSMPHGANFSVPGAGKTTVTFALHLLTQQPGQHLLVIGPKTAFPAWREVVGDCMDPAAPDGNAEPFVVLDGRPQDVDRLLTSGATRFLMTYDLMVRTELIFNTGTAGMQVNNQANTATLFDITNAGNVGIGITSPGLRLDVEGGNTGYPIAIGGGAQTAGNLRLATAGTENLDFGWSGAAPWGFWIQGTLNTNTSSAPLLLNPNGGNVGIGTTAPADALQVRSGTNQNFACCASTPMSSGVYIQSYNDAVNTFEGMAFGASSYDFTQGNVGIGTTAPASELHVYGAGAGTGAPASGPGTILVQDSNEGAGSGGAVLFGEVQGQGYFSGIKGYVTNGGGNSIGDLAFYTRNATGDAALTERMRILSGGNVGIRTTNPSTFPLQVAGSVGPDADNTYDLGSAALRWRNIYSAGSLSLGGLSLTNLTQGSVVFAGAGGVISQDNPNFFYDATNHRLGIATTVPRGTLDISTTNNNIDGLVIDQHNGDNTHSIQTYIDNSWATRTTYAGACCNALYIEPDVGATTIYGPTTIGNGNASGSGLTVNGTLTVAAYGNLLLHNGNGDGATFNTVDAAIESWWGIGFRSNCCGDPVPYPIVFDTRSGNIFAYGNVSVDGAYQINSTTVLAYPDGGADTSSIAVGPGALAGQTSSGQQNTAVGNSAMWQATGPDNTAVGLYALNGLTSGSQNVAVGMQAVAGAGTALTGSFNTGVGQYALYGEQGVGQYNTATGAYAMYYNTTGSYNTAVGGQALQNDTTGAYNVAMGWQAMLGISSTPLTGSGNVGIGMAALTAIQGGAANNVAIGEAAMMDTTNASQNTVVGMEADLYATTGSNNTAVGFQAMLGAYGAGLTGTGNNTAVGDSALLNIQGGAANNTAVGGQALQGNTTGAPNSAFGEGALYTNQTGTNNTAIGYNALYHSTYNYNTAVGDSSLYALTAPAHNNVALGYQAGQYITTGSYNIAIGTQAMQSASGTPLTGAVNIAVGYAALSSIQGNTSDNIAIGPYALYADTTGSDNTALGYGAGQSITTGTNNVFLGSGAQALAATDSNEIVLGASATGNSSNTVTLGNTSITGLYAKVTTITGTSDRRLKKDIEDADLGLDFIEKLRPVSYRYNNGDNTLRYGFIAQDVEQALPKSLQDMIETSQPAHGLALIVRDHDKDRTYNMGYSELLSPLVKSVQQLKTSDDNAQKKEQDDIADLKQLIAAQQKDIAALKQQIQNLAPAH